ncbi:S8 family peptidase [Zooshikella sp. RANM57]|uniref:S8 family peptidase n=1 Tax=Zooshikella sp. RANM57 TaxID=3425863 RepID=UPI003D6F5A63
MIKKNIFPPLGIISIVVLSSTVNPTIANTPFSSYAKKVTPSLMAENITASTNRIIIKFKTPKNNKKNTSPAVTNKVQIESALSMLRGFQAKPLRHTSNGAQVYSLGETLDIDTVEALANQISNDSRIEYAEPDYILTKQETPNDARYSEQWNYYDTQGGINLPEAWNITKGNSKTTVAIIDTGLVKHPDIETKRILPGYDFISDAWTANDGDGRDDNPLDTGDAINAGECGRNSQGNPVPAKDQPSSWHGTHVAGIIAASGNNQQGIVGIAWKSSILPIRVLGKCGGYTSDIADGIRWAAGLNVLDVPDNQYPAHVINMSLGGKHACSRTYQNAINDAISQGTSVIVAAGNSADDASQYTPANCKGVISIAATNRKGDMSYYSNYGQSVDVAAPGGETRIVINGHVQQQTYNGILSTIEGGYAFYQGTSMAAPHVAGLAALMYSVNPKLTPAETKQILKETAKPFSANAPLCKKYDCGAGIIDAGAAVKKVKSIMDEDTTTPETEDDTCSWLDWSC